MARIRTVKPEIWTDETFTECSLSARLLFIATWNFADDNGNIEYSAKQLKMKIFPADNIDIIPLISELLFLGLLIPYENSGKKYLHIKGFKKHQIVNRPSKTSIPLMEDSLSEHIPLMEDSLTEGKGREGKGKEKDKRPTATRARNSLSECFDKNEDRLKALFPHTDYEAEREVCLSHYSQQAVIDPYQVILKWFNRIPKPKPQQQPKTFEEIKMDNTKKAMIEFVKGAPDARQSGEQSQICSATG